MCRRKIESKRAEWKSRAIYFPGLNGLRAIAALTVLWPPVIQCTMIYIAVTVLTIVIAYVSYRYFESAILRYKSKFAVVDSRNSYR